MSRNIETHLVFTNLKKGYYDSVLLNKFWPVLLKIGVYSGYVRSMEVLYNNIASSINIASRLTCNYNYLQAE